MSELPSYAEMHARQQQACTLHYLSGAPEESPALDGVLSEVGERRELGGYERFSLLFRADEGSGPRQGTYAIRFADHARWEIFLVPVARVEAQIVYEACFNRGVQG